MQAGAVAEVLKALRPYAYGWRCELPTSVHFFGHPVSLEMETSPFPVEKLPSEPSQDETNLAWLILTGMLEVLEIVHRQYAVYNADFPEVIAKIDRPRLWICREFQERDGKDRWAFVVGISDAPDWSIFIEFRSQEFLEVWSGD